MESKIHLRIGRSEENDLVIDNVDIELFHLELFCDANNNVFITDLNSKTGTFVNGVRMYGYTILGLGDIVVLGANYELKWTKYQLDLKNESKPTKPPVAVSNPLRTSEKKPPIQPNTKNEMNTEKKPSSSPSSKSVKAKPNYFSSINIQIVVIYALLSVGIYMVYLYI
jgi:pSer/pThr/pTyr-binding forkhead associated (FHA) protein